VGINLETGWIYFETAKGTKCRMELKEVIAVRAYSKKSSGGNEYMEIWLKGVPKSLFFSKGKPEDPSKDNLMSGDEDFLTYETCEELERIFDKYFCDC